MDFVVTPTYLDFFDEETPSINDLIHDVPNSLIVSLISAINSELYLHNDLLSQIKIFDFLLNRQAEGIKQTLTGKLLDFVAKNGQVSLYSKHLCIEFLHRALTRDISPNEIEDTTIQQELNIFKALIVIAEEEGRKISLPSSSKSPADFMRISAWPSMINQYGLNNSTNGMNEVIKSKCLFDYLQFGSEYSEYVDEFLRLYNVPNSFTYVHNIASLLTRVEQDRTNSFKPFVVRVDDSFLENIFVELSLDAKEYKQVYKKEKKNYLGIKSKPLYRLDDGHFIVMDMNFFSKRIYNGLLYDFYDKSGINQVSRFSSFIDFKAYIGRNSIENYLFRKLINGCFPNKYAIKIFDNGAEASLPDAYVRYRNKIFLFEIKDSYFNSKAIDSFDITAITEEINLKFNSPKKGTGQLIKSILKLREGPFENTTYVDLGLKTRNLEIYPVLVYTDDFFGLPGISHYLAEEFDEKCKEIKSHGFKKIMGLTFMNINFLIENLDLFEDKRISMDKIIVKHNHEIKKRELKLSKHVGNEKLVGPLFEPFESVFQKTHNFELKRDKYVESAFRILDLMQGL